MTMLCAEVSSVKLPCPPLPFDEHNELAWMAELEPSWSILPRVDGSGLTPEEYARLTRQREKVKAAYTAAAPEADALDVRRVTEAAAKDALRQILKGRPLAPCCDSLEEAPCLGCSSHLDIPGADESMSAEELADLAELNEQFPEGAVEADLAHWPAYDRWPQFTSNWHWSDTPTPVDDELLDLPQLIELTARRFRSLDNSFGDLLGDRLERLAREVRATSATTAAEIDARLEVLERDFTAPVEFEPELTAAGHWA